MPGLCVVARLILCDDDHCLLEIDLYLVLHINRVRVVL